MRIRSFVLLTCLLFSSEVKASVSLNSNITRICAQSQFFLKKAVSMTKIPLPFVLKIKFRTPYIFDLEFQQNFDIAFVRDTSKNDYTSFISRSSLQVSKRKLIKTIYERVVFYFDFYIPFLFFNVALLTKEVGKFKFFHAPEYENKKGERKRGRSFCSFPYFFTYWKKYSLYWFVDFCGPKVKMIISNLYPFACLFSFRFDILVCSYLSCCIKIPFDIVFHFFFLPFTYLCLNKVCKNEKEKITENNVKKSDNEKKLQSIIPLAINKILSLFSFSIGIFDEEGIEESL